MNLMGRNGKTRQSITIDRKSHEHVPMRNGWNDDCREVVYGRALNDVVVSRERF